MWSNWRNNWSKYWVKYPYEDIFMKYGLMYYKSTDNLGDDIQTYASMKFLPHIDYYIDREDLSCFVPKEKEYVSMIMNGWFIHNKLAWPPSPYINPLLISMHFKVLENTDIGDIYLKDFGGEILKRFGPVGARDIETKNRLENNEIDSYFSGCMTLTIEKFCKVKKKKKICLVDVPKSVYLKVKENTDCEIEVITHFLNQKETEKKSFNERMQNVEKVLKKYQESKIVITTRLHVALPCVALGTPVIVLHKEVFDEDRLGSYFYLFTNYIEEDFLNMDIKKVLDKPKKNSKEYIKIKKQLKKRCKEFIKISEGTEFDKNRLPKIEEYKEYTNRLSWYKNIYEKERLIVEKIEQKRIEEFNSYNKNLKEIYKEKLD